VSEISEKVVFAKYRFLPIFFFLAIFWRFWPERFGSSLAAVKNTMKHKNLMQPELEQLGAASF
jgi:uncharacterized protein Usg